MTKVSVGNIIVSRYLDFNDEVKKGLFFVYAMRPKGDGLYDLSVIKISTKRRNFEVILKSDVFKFLHYDSYINCTDLQVVSSSQVDSVVGYVSGRLMGVIKNQLKNAMRSCYVQIDDYVNKDVTTSGAYSDNPRRGGLTLDGNTLMLDGRPLTAETLRSILANVD